MKRTLALCLTALVLGFPADTVHAEAWPSRSIKVIVPIAPGSVIDVAPRLVFEQLATQLGQPVVVENRAGAGGLRQATPLEASSSDTHDPLSVGSPPPLRPGESYRAAVAILLP